MSARAEKLHRNRTFPCADDNSNQPCVKHVITTVYICRANVIMMVCNNICSEPMTRCSDIKLKNCRERGLGVAATCVSTRTHGLRLLLQAQFPAAIVCLPKISENAIKIFGADHQLVRLHNQTTRGSNMST